ncbi:MAG: DUF2889 domain-containing protein [Gemmatimonadota bacterium]
MPDAPSRRHVHTRTIRVEAYVRDDQLWDIEVELLDRKSRDFMLATGVRKVGEPVHDLRLAVTIDAQMNIVDARAESNRVPYPGFCEPIATEYRKLIGLNLFRNFRRQVRERFGGAYGCTHLTELTDVLPSAAIQAFANEVYPTRDAADRERDTDQRKPFQLDRCHALRAAGPAVAKFYPRWHRASDASQDETEASRA